MKIEVGSSFLELVQGDISKQHTEAIVNAANERLAPGGGVAGVIHRAAGQNSGRSVRGSVDAEPERRRSRRATDCQLVASSTPLAQSTVEAPRTPRSSRHAIRTA